MPGVPLRGTFANSVDPYQMLRNAASDQGLPCLHSVQKIQEIIKES